MNCEFCGNKLTGFVIFNCKHCGKSLCSKHRLPEAHNCVYFKPKSKVNQSRTYEFVNIPIGNENTTEGDVIVNRTYNERRNKRNRYPKKKPSFGQSVRKFGLKSATTYRIKKSKVLQLSLLLLSLIVIALINNFFVNDLLQFIFYVVEIVFVGYFMFRLLKFFDRIPTNSDLGLFGLRILSGIIGVVGLYMLIIFWWFGWSIIWFQGSIGVSTLRSGFNMFGLGPLVDIFTFGVDFHLPYTGVVIYLAVTFTMVLTGGYLFFKFQRRTGGFVWIGRA